MTMSLNNISFPNPNSTTNNTSSPPVVLSFPQHLQSEHGQKGILSRLESEIRLLENLKKFLHSQIKAGKEYSVALGNASTSAMKNLTDSSHTSESTTDSVVTKVCLHILEEVQSAATTVKENSEFLQSTTVVQLTELIQEKKSLLKLSREEYDRIKGKLEQYKESVHKFHEAYLKCHNSYESSRTKYEEHCAKGNPKGWQNIPKLRDISFDENEIHLGLGLRPGRKSDETREKFYRARKRLNISHADYLLHIQEATEYDRDLRTILLPGLLQMQQNWCEKGIKKWKDILDQIWSNSPPLTSIQGKLQEFEFPKEYQELIIKHKTMPLEPTNFKFEPAVCSNQPFTQPAIIVDSSTVDALRNRQSDIEKRLKNSETSQKDRADHISKMKPSLLADMKGAELCMVKCETDRLRSLKNHVDNLFKLKISDTSSQVSQSHLDETISLLSEQSVKKGASRLATFFRSKTKKSVSFDESSSIVIHSSNSVAGDQADTISISTIDRNMNALLDEDWFHGVLPREDVVRLLRTDGDFLVRETMKNDERQIVLSVYWNGPKHFIVQTTPDGQFRFEGPIFPTVKELMDDYVHTKSPITSRSGAVIKRPVKRENWELNNDDVRLIEKIGRGNFGDVYKASLNGSLVAVKTCKVNLPDEQKKKFLQEGRILKQYCHANIVSFVGICVQKQPIMIVMELVPGGSLLTHLKNKGVMLAIRQLTKMCVDAAAGMKYLEEKHCIHRDLAARNCLLDEKNSVKISDFGMSREEQEYTVSDGLKQIPIKWTAPEALNYGKYTSLSDVWSYGILMFEIFSRGQTPYQGLSNTKAREMVESGYRMPAPDRTPDVIYQLMTRCWQYDPEQRPRFSEIHSELEITLNSDLI